MQVINCMTNTFCNVDILFQISREVVHILKSMLDEKRWKIHTYLQYNGRDER